MRRDSVTDNRDGERELDVRESAEIGCQPRGFAPRVIPQHAQAVAAQLADDAATTPEHLAARFAHSLAERPLFCDLLAHVPVSLERGVQPDIVREFTISALDAVDRIVAAVQDSGALHQVAGIRDLIAVE
ncbi:hypothetical protein AB0L63_19510 [Nocardia sp. NPDC051990]|uniref:hypothetical protein n=1 Tax=Nocardia sp. NPDC051990 TaxID=3155285 RepID=UPI00343F4E49